MLTPSGSNSGCGWEGAGILDAKCPSPTVEGQRRSLPSEPGDRVGRRGHRSPSSAFHPASLFWLRAEAETLLLGWPTSGRAPCFSTTEIKKFSNRSIRGAQVNLLQLWGSRQSPFRGGDHFRWSISLRCRNGRAHLASFLRCCLADLPLGMKRRLVITR